VLLVLVAVEVGIVEEAGHRKVGAYAAGHRGGDLSAEQGARGLRGRSHEAALEQDCGVRMSVDTFFAYVGVYPSVEAAEADYQRVKTLHTEAQLIDAYDAAVVEHQPDGKVKITKKHETPTRAGGVLGAGVGLATGLVVALFPFAAIGGGLLAATTGGGAVLGAVAGRAAAGMSRKDLKELDEGQAGLVVVAVSDMGAKVKKAMESAEKLEARELRADTEQMEQDAKSAAE